MTTDARVREVATLTIAAGASQSGSYTCNAGTIVGFLPLGDTLEEMTVEIQRAADGEEQTDSVDTTWYPLADLENTSVPISDNTNSRKLMAVGAYLQEFAAIPHRAKVRLARSGTGAAVSVVVLARVFQG